MAKTPSAHDAAVFWLVVLSAVCAVIVALVWVLSKRRGVLIVRLDGLRQAGRDTLAVAEGAAMAIAPMLNSNKPIAAEIRSEYDRAITLLDRAGAALDSGVAIETLSRSNQEAAQAAMLLSTVLRKLNIDTPMANPPDVPFSCCFYCSLQDPAPNIEKVVVDADGNRISVLICSACQAQLNRGRTPRIATISLGDMVVPWFAVPGQPWYYVYSGFAWQHWLPFIIGIDAGTWFTGGWDYSAGWRDPHSLTGAGASAEAIDGGTVSSDASGDRTEGSVDRDVVAGGDGP